MELSEFSSMINLSEAELQERVVRECVRSLFYTEGIDDESRTVERQSGFRRAMADAVREAINRKVDEIAEEHIGPMIGMMVEEISLQETNRWGEVIKGTKALTFKEYLVQRAEAYMRELVDYEGKPVQERDRHARRGVQARVAHMIESYFHHQIEQAMRTALENANASIVNGIQETVKLKLEEIAKKLKCSVHLGK